MLDQRIFKEIVLNEDNRRQVFDTSKRPFRWICSIEVFFGEPVVNALGLLESPVSSWLSLPTVRSGCGSGLLIGANKVLTAGHVLLGLKVFKNPFDGSLSIKPVYPSRINIIPGRKASYAANPAPFGQWQGKRLIINPYFEKKLTGPAAKIKATQILSALPYDIGILEFFYSQKASY